VQNIAARVVGAKVQLSGLAAHLTPTHVRSSIITE